VLQHYTYCNASCRSQTEHIRGRNFLTAPKNLRLARSRAVLEDVSLSEPVDRALCQEVERLLKKHKQNQQLSTLLLQPIAPLKAIAPQT
jgi:hypothetical protein